MAQRRHPSAHRRLARGARQAFALAGTASLTMLCIAAAPPASARVPSLRDRSPATVTADPLPTVQINGVVWTQVMIGNVVYAGGEFTAARPAGAAAGTQETRRSNLLAYDITTGELITTFTPGTFNGAIRALAVSTDKKTLYIGGKFTKVGTEKRGHFAAVKTTTGALNKSIKPSFNSWIYALAADSKSVFAGGTFASVNGKARSRLAAVSIKSGKLSGWKAKANATVRALVLTPKSKLLVAGGSFSKLNSTKASGSGAVSPSSGKTKTWKINQVVKNGKKNAGIWGLATDGDTVYGTGFTWGGGNFEGVFAASSKDGTLKWLQDCHGDTYAVAPIGDVVYSVGHPHYCTNIGGFPDTVPRSRWFHALAVTKKAAGTVAKNGQTTSRAYSNFEGKPAPGLLNWFPQLGTGTYTGQKQAAWSVVGNSKFISLGGEFPVVSGKPQEGLVRMAVPSIAPSEVGPTGGPTAIGLAATPQADGSVALSWNQLWDRDDLRLIYELSRDDTVIDRRAVSVPFWERSAMSFIDNEAAAGYLSKVVTYQVKVSDPHGNYIASFKVKVQPTG